MPLSATCGISSPFALLSPTCGQVVYVLLDRSPLEAGQVLLPVRLAYLRHAASVRPEPGSNSPRESDPAKAPPRKGSPAGNTCPSHREGELVTGSPKRAVGPLLARTSSAYFRRSKQVDLTVFSHCSVFKEPAPRFPADRIRPSRAQTYPLTSQPNPHRGHKKPPLRFGEVQRTIATINSLPQEE